MWKEDMTFYEFMYYRVLTLQKEMNNEACSNRICLFMSLTGDYYMQMRKIHTCEE